MDKAFSLLEFGKIKERLAGFSHSEISSRMIDELAILDRASLASELEMLRQTIDLIDRFSTFPIDYSPDLEQSLSYAEKGGKLSAKQLDEVARDILCGDALIGYFSKIPDRDNRVKEYALKLPILKSLEETIREAIDPSLEIKDSASSALANIRIKIARLEKKSMDSLSMLANKYRSFLNGTGFALKNGKYCLPVKNDFKSKVKGYIQDVSSSGETVFVEPEELLYIESEIASLRREEEAEISRILAHLSMLVAEKGEEILLENKMIGYLDFLNAKANYALSTSSHVGYLSEKKEIAIFSAIHPLLDPKVAVPNDFILSEKEPAIIISGPNAGGKTVALKTLGLLVIMHECGLAIPAKEGAEISYIEHVYADIGDNQSIEDNLSTFAGHIASVSSILKEAGNNDLILLDEVGTGTSPQEGEAIAYAIIKEILDRGSFLLATSHFEALKAYALKEERLVSASLIYDDEKMAPTYRLKRGLPGESYAFEVASKYGLSPKIIDDARAFMGHEKEDTGIEASRKLLSILLEEEKIKDDMAKKQEEISALKAKLEHQESLSKKREEEILQKAKQKQEEIIAKAKEQAEQAIKELANPSLKLHEAIAIKKDVEKLESFKIEEEETYDEELEVGDYVSIPVYGIEGEVRSIGKKEVEVVTSNGSKFKISKEKVKKVSRPKYKETVDLIKFRKNTNNLLEINLIGQRYDEAKINLEAYLDSCRANRVSRVRIIHGFGSGVLKKMTWEYLSAHPEFVGSFESADQYEGGLGATIVHLK